jgi:hypothetical protein
MLFRRKDPSIDPKERAIWGDLMALGMVFPIAIALGFFLGRWAGKALGYPRAGILIGLFWGVGAGFWELYKTTIRLNRYDGSGPGPGDGKDGDGTPGA